MKEVEFKNLDTSKKKDLTEICVLGNTCLPRSSQEALEILGRRTTANLSEQTPCNRETGLPDISLSHDLHTKMLSILGRPMPNTPSQVSPVARRPLPKAKSISIIICKLFIFPHITTHRLQQPGLSLDPSVSNL